MDVLSLKRTTEILEKYGLSVVQEMATYLSATVNLKNSITSEVKYDGELNVVVPAYGLYVNDGRRAGSKMPPAKPIADWMATKGIDPKALYPIRRKIARDGIQPRPFFHYFYDKIDTLVLDVANALAVDVAELIVNKFEQTN